VRLLIAEDDAALREVLVRGLRESGYVVDAVGDGEAALTYLSTYDYAVAVLDWRMPKLSGFQALAKFRARGGSAPVLMLTALDRPADRVAGLDQGADDYLVKPFDFSELLARLRALQRRRLTSRDPLLRCGDVVLDPASYETTVGNRPVVLTAIERAILELLLRRMPAVVTRRSIAIHAWPSEAHGISSNTIDVHLARLRAKLAGAHAQVETVRGVGYRMTPS
jgi:DNA-binding response OmpR family regulator